MENKNYDDLPAYRVEVDMSRGKDGYGWTVFSKQPPNNCSEEECVYQLEAHGYAESPSKAWKAGHAMAEKIIERDVGEKEWEVELYELHSQVYTITAKSQEEAIQNVLEGCGISSDDGPEFIEIADKYAANGLPSGVRSVEEV